MVSSVRKDVGDRTRLTADLLGDGWSVVPDVVAPEMLVGLRNAIDRAVDAETDYHGRTDHQWHNRVLFCPRYGGAFTDLLDHEGVFGPADAVLGDDAILYTMTTSCLPPGGGNTSGALHADIARVVPGYVLGVTVFVAVDDMNASTGSTLLLPGSQEMAAAPDDAEFERRAVRLEMPAGAVAYVHPRLWHRSTVNASDRVRRTLLTLMVRPWMKQRFDVTSLVPEDVQARLSPVAARRLGLRSRPPGSYDEFYANGRSGSHWTS